MRICVRSRVLAILKSCCCCCWEWTGGIFHFRVASRQQSSHAKTVVFFLWRGKSEKSKVVPDSWGDVIFTTSWLSLFRPPPLLMLVVLLQSRQGWKRLDKTWMEGKDFLHASNEDYFVRSQFFLKLLERNFVVKLLKVPPFRQCFSSRNFLGWVICFSLPMEHDKFAFAD